MDSSTLWLLFISIGIGTFLIRASFVEFHGCLSSRNHRLNKLFAFLPPAILAALCVPALLVDSAANSLQIDACKLVAAMMTVVVARCCKGVFWPILAGMGGLWISRWLL